MKLRTLTRPVYFLRRLNYKFYEIRHPDEPWLAQGAVRFLHDNLTADGIGWEWGSGRSTAWFARRLRFVTSVEHDGEWHKIVQAKLAAADLANIDYRHIALDHPVDEPTHAHYDVLPSYVTVATDLANNSLDFALIDGHYRMACVLAIVPKMKPGGLLVIDNSNWLASIGEWGVPAEWPIVHQSENVMSQTTIWRRPV
jgi:hypothetical protein